MRASRVITAGAVAAITVGSVSLSPVTQAKAATTGLPSASRGTHARVSPLSHRARMGSYGASRFAGAAAKLPSSLDRQLRKQLGITPEQFLADGQAAADAGQVIAALRADGATVFGAKLNGTALTLTVRGAADAAAAEADGATAVIGTAQPTKTVTAKAVSSPADGTSRLLGGDLWAYLTDINTGDGIVCSTGFNGYAKSTGAREFITAGHCADYRDTGEPAPADGIVYAATDETPVYLDTDVPLQYPALGSLDQSSFHFGGGQDSGIVKVTDAKAAPAPAVNTWGSSDTSAGTNSTPSQGVENSGNGKVPVLAAAAAVNGEPVCHSGERTGWQCGTVENPGNAPYVTSPVQGVTQIQTVDGFESSVCLLPGDSGGSFVSGEYAVGVASAATFTPQSGSGPGANTCSSGGGFSIAYPMTTAASGEESAAQSARDFELAVYVPVPVVTTAKADGVTGNGVISGDLPAPFATGTPVSLSLDGHAKAATTADSSGRWSFSLTGLAAGIRAYTVTAGSGHSTASRSGTLSVVPGTFTNIKAPGVSGAVRVGSKVVASPGTWSVAGPTFTYQWTANGKNITGAVNASYTIPASLLGTKLSVLVTAHKSGYMNAVKASAAVVVAKGSFAVVVKPQLSGTPAVGKALTVTQGTWNPLPAIKIQWYANGKPVARATGTSLKLSTALRGQIISVAVTAGKLAYVPATVRLAEGTRVR